MKKEEKTEIVRFIGEKDPNRTSHLSYGMASARYKSTLYQKRMLDCILEAVQPEIKGQMRIGNEIKIVTGKEDKWNPIVQIPMSLILQKDSQSNLYAVKKAAKDLIKNVIEYNDKEVGWIVFAPIIGAHIPPNTSILNLQVHHQFWQKLVDFKKGERNVDTRIALQCNSVYSNRLYELLAGTDGVITYNIDTLKKMFGIENKYKLTADFLRKVIEPAKQDLDSFSPWSFTYTLKKEGKKIVGINFTPVHHRHNENENLKAEEAMKHADLESLVPSRDLRHFLLGECGFNADGLLNNKSLFAEAQIVIKDFNKLLFELIENADKQGVPRPPYIVGGIKRTLSNIKKKAEAKSARRGTPANCKKEKNYHSGFFDERRKTDITSERNEDYHSSF